MKRLQRFQALFLFFTVKLPCQTPELSAYLAEVDNQAQDLFDTIVNQTKEVQGITEELKAENPMEWVRQMNSIINMAEEFVLQELVYV